MGGATERTPSTALAVVGLADRFFPTAPVSDVVPVEACALTVGRAQRQQALENALGIREVAEPPTTTREAVEATGLKRMRQFYRAFPEGSALPAELGGPDKGAASRHLSGADPKGAAVRHLSIGAAGLLFPPVLSWTHYRLLLSVEKQEARSFYEIEAARESWSVRELETAR